MLTLPRPPRNITIRPLLRRDARPLARLALETGGAETAADWSAVLRRARTGGMVALVAEADGRQVGYVTGAVRLAYGRSEPAGWIEAFAVDAQWRGHGLGRALAMELFERFRALGATHVYTVLPLGDLTLAPFLRDLGLREEPLTCIGRSL